MKAKPKPSARSGGRGTGPAAPKPKRVFIVDDHPMMLDGMSRLINSEPGFVCCGTAKSAEAAVAEIDRTRPDLVITDITLPNRSGFDLIKDIVSMFPEMVVFVYSMHDEMFYAERALRAGARGYLMKEAGSEAMLDAMQRVANGEIAVSPKIAAQILALFSGQQPRASSSPVSKLTDREFDVYQLIGDGKSTGEIAERLHLSAKTVAVHRDHIREKLGLKTIAEIMRHAMQWKG